MTIQTRQLNLRIDVDSDELLTYLAERRNIPKAILVREMIMNFLVEDALEFLLNDYRAGKIGLTQLIKLSRLPPRMVLLKIAEKEIEPSISEVADEYTEKLKSEIHAKLQKGELKWKKSPQKHKKKDAIPLSTQEIDALE